MIRKKSETSEVVLYNFDVKNQELKLLHRSEDIPTEFRSYQKLWRLTDKHRKVETIIISI